MVGSLIFYTIPLTAQPAPLWGVPVKPVSIEKPHCSGNSDR